MRIISQKGLDYVDIPYENAVIGIEDNYECEGYIVTAIVENRSYDLGIYKSEENAKTVVNMLLGVGTSSRSDMGVQMPEDSEVEELAGE